LAIKPVIGDFECPTGNVETIQIVPCGPTTVNRIWSVLYGPTATTPAIIKPSSGDTFSITVLPGPNLLQVIITSSDPSTRTIVVQQPGIGGADPTILEDDIEIDDGQAVWSPQIVGV